MAASDSGPGGINPSQRSATSASVVIVLSGGRLRAWEHLCLTALADSGAAKITGIVSAPEPRTSFYRAFRDGCLAGLALIRAMRRPPAALADVGLNVMPDDVPVLDGSVLAKGSFDSAAVTFVAGLSPSLVLIFGVCTPALKSRLAAHAKWGSWSFHFGETHNDLPEVATLDAMIQQSAVICATLKMTIGDVDRVLHCGATKVFQSRPLKTVNDLCFAISTWARRACQDINGNGFLESRFPEVEKTKKLEITRRPSSIRLVSSVVLGSIRTQVRYKLFHQQWNVGMVQAPIAVVAGLEGSKAQKDSLNGTLWMREQRGSFFADPFGYEISTGTIRILFELFDWRQGKGVIAARSFSHSSYGEIVRILEAPTHLSYPYIAKFQGQRIYVPEHSAGRDVSAFFLDENGNTRSKKTLLPRVELIDCTFIDWAGKTWMFALDDGCRTDNTELNLYFADRLDGAWRAHPMNPIKTDVRSSRPGGTPFTHEGKLFRPGQDCSTHYGRGLIINEVLELSETAYLERAVSIVGPPQESIYSDGLHTISEVGGVTLIDGARKQIKFSS